ncbi:hypothetical protein T4C_1606 [Trichinella pseudospiralis]|uniref:Uncharacterized protein n=1 Tax=Trichinella pseudospiralis TaxID=6337 RepID=A0A0V1GA33_TRIPS|nr:hypothetical protein T4C_1606 [Trichinella pseudospiralis]
MACSEIIFDHVTPFDVALNETIECFAVPNEVLCNAVL